MSRINYNWFGVKRPRPHYLYFVTQVEPDVWVVEDTRPPNDQVWQLYHGLDDVPYTYESSCITLVVEAGVNLPKDVATSIVKYALNQHFDSFPKASEE